MMAKERGKIKAGKAGVNKIPPQTQVKSIWDQVLEKEELAEKKKNDRDRAFLSGTRV